MTTGIADARGLRLDSHVRRSLANRQSVPPSRWLEKMLREVRELDRFICDGWDSLDPRDRQFFHALVLGLPPPPETIGERIDRSVWSVTTLLNLAFNREEAIEYLVAVGDLFETIKDRVGAEVWRETLADPDQMERAERGRKQIAASKFKVVS